MTTSTTPTTRFRVFTVAAAVGLLGIGGVLAYAAAAGTSSPPPSTTVVSDVAGVDTNAQPAAAQVGSFRGSLAVAERELSKLALSRRAPIAGDTPPAALRSALIARGLLADRAHVVTAGPQRTVYVVPGKQGEVCLADVGGLGCFDPASIERGQANILSGCMPGHESESEILGLIPDNVTNVVMTLSDGRRTPVNVAGNLFVTYIPNGTVGSLSWQQSSLGSIVVPDLTALPIDSHCAPLPTG